MLLPGALPSSGNDLFGLIAELDSHLPVRVKNLCGGEILFAVAGRVRCNLRSLGTGPACLFELFSYLPGAWARSSKILLGVAFDLGRSALSALDLVTEIAQPIHQLRLVDGGGELLRLKEAVLLKSARSTVRALGYVEDDGMGVKLRCGVTGDGPRRVVLELGGNEFTGRFSRMVAADPRLGVSLKLVQGFGDSDAVRLPDLLIAAYKSRKRDRLRS